MMALPFLFTTLGLAAVWRGRRNAAIGLLGLSLIMMIALFRMHATDALGLSL